MRKVLFKAAIGNKEGLDDLEMTNEGYFHGISTEQGYSIIEDKDGSLNYVRFDRFKFVDSPDSIDWEQRRYEIARDLFVHNEMSIVGAIKGAYEFVEAIKTYKK